MPLTVIQTEDIYFSKTREYFEEVISSYSIGNYRSAIVMLYSVAICDILYKLQELRDMYNDTIADEILGEVERSRNEHDSKSKSKWEKEFIDNVYKKTKLLDLEAYTNLNHLYDHRNFSAHPALNGNYELIAPSKETTIAHIKNILQDILVKPPIFIKNVINTLTEDLRDKKDIYLNATNELDLYLNNKYFCRMPESMKIATFKAFWKFCFCLPDDEDCKQNIHINRKALKILFDGFQREALEFIKHNENLFTVATDVNCIRNLILFLSECPVIYTELNTDTRLQIETYLKTDTGAQIIAWFTYPTLTQHIEVLRESKILKLPDNVIRNLVEHYTDNGMIHELLEFFIELYGKSGSYDTADSRFNLLIEPYMDKMSAALLIKLIEATNSNRQIWGRGAALNANNKIMLATRNLLPKDFDYSQYTHFEFDDNTKTSEDIDDDRDLFEI